MLSSRGRVMWRMPSTSPPLLCPGGLAASPRARPRPFAALALSRDGQIGIEIAECPKTGGAGMVCVLRRPISVGERVRFAFCLTGFSQ